MIKSGDFGLFVDYLNHVCEFHAETICNALGYYFMDSSKWSCPEEGPILLQLLTLCDVAGFNFFLEDWDPVNNIGLIVKSMWPDFKSPYHLCSDDVSSSEEVQQ